MKSLLNLFISFMIIGIGAYGGGLVTIPLIQHEIVTKNHWLAFDELAEIFAIAQMTPGPIAVNTATFTGFRLSGILGAVVATTAVILPSILILLLVTALINRFKSNKYLRRFRHGIQLGVLSLIFFAVWTYGSGVIKGWLDLGIAMVAFVLLVVFERKLHPIVVILSCGVLGIIIF